VDPVLTSSRACAGRIEICKGVPSFEAGLAVQSSSYFDRLWRQGGTSARYVLLLTKLPYDEYKQLQGTQQRLDGAVTENAIAAAADATDSGVGGQKKMQRRARAALPGSAADLLERGVMGASLPASATSLGALDGDAGVEDAWSAFLNGGGGAAGAIAAHEAKQAASKPTRASGGGRYNREELDDATEGDNDTIVRDAEPRVATELDPHFSDSDGNSDDEGGFAGQGDDWSARKAKNKSKAPRKEARRKPRGPQRNNIREFHRQNKLRRQEREYQRQTR